MAIAASTDKVRLLSTDGGHRETAGKAEPPYVILGEMFFVLAIFVSFGVIDTLPTIVWLAVAALGLSVAMIAPIGSLSRTFVSVPLMLFLVWGASSLAWSADAPRWRTEVLHLVPLTLATVLVASLLPIDRIVHAVKTATVGGVAFTIVLMIVHPSTTTVAILPEDQGTQLGWHGFFGHKTGMMAYVALMVITFVTLEDRKWVRQTVILVALVLAIGSQSSTGMSCLVAIAITSVWLNAYLRQSGRFTAAFMFVSVFVGVALVAVVSLLLPTLVNLYGKDLTLSGRTQIWRTSVATIKQKPIAGYGLGGVWADPAREPTATMLRDIGFRAWHAHNAALELLLEFGVVGLGLYVAWFGSVLTAAWRALQTVPNLARWAVLFCVMQLVMGVSEVMVFGGWLVGLAMLRGVLAQSTAPPVDPTAEPLGRRMLLSR